jgi:hypothetical protein
LAKCSNMHWARLRIYWHISLLISCCVWVSEQWNGSYKQQKNFNDGQVNTGLTLLLVAWLTSVSSLVLMYLV